jgi:hypothetical protein
MSINKIFKIFNIFYFEKYLKMGIGDWAQSPIPNPQSPIPNPQSPFESLNK